MPYVSRHDFFMSTYLTSAAHDPGWIWAHSGSGYGMLQTREYGLIGAHVYTCILVCGDRRGEDLIAAHSCHTPRCFWSEHVTWKTWAENQADRITDGTETRGVDVKQAKLTETQVREVRERYARGGITMKALGAEYGISKSAIHFITSRQRWQHVE